MIACDSLSDDSILYFSLNSIVIPCALSHGIESKYPRPCKFRHINGIGIFRSFLRPFPWHVGGYYRYHQWGVVQKMSIPRTGISIDLDSSLASFHLHTSLGLGCTVTLGGNLLAIAWLVGCSADIGYRTWAATI